jgi:hypothetical protein
VEILFRQKILSSRDKRLGNQFEHGADCQLTKNYLSNQLSTTRRAVDAIEGGSTPWHAVALGEGGSTKNHFSAKFSDGNAAKL